MTVTPDFASCLAACLRNEDLYAPTTFSVYPILEVCILRRVRPPRTVVEHNNSCSFILVIFKADCFSTVFPKPVLSFTERSNASNYNILWKS